MPTERKGQIERLTCTVPEAGEMLGIGRTLAYEAANRGEIPTVSIGGRLVVPLATLRRKLGIEPEVEAGSL